MTASFVGADPDQLEALARTFASSAEELDVMRQHLLSLHFDVAWEGGDADQARTRMEVEHGPALAMVTTALRGAQATLVTQAQQQREASQPDSVAALPIRNAVPTTSASGSGGNVEPIYSPRHPFEDSDDILADFAAAAAAINRVPGAAQLSKTLPVMGGLVAAADQYDRDSDDDQYNNAQLATRAAWKGGLTTLGGVAGAAALAEAAVPLAAASAVLGPEAPVVVEAGALAVGGYLGSTIGGAVADQTMYVPDAVGDAIDAGVGEIQDAADNVKEAAGNTLQAAEDVASDFGDGLGELGRKLRFG